MASKKYMIQPLTPPRQRKSSALSILAKYANSTGRSNESKQRATDLPVPTLPFAPYSPSYDIPDYHDRSHYKPMENASRDRQQRPHELEADLKYYRDYCHKERVRDAALDDHSEEEDEEDEEDEDDPEGDAAEPMPDNGDFAAWRRAMNSKLAAQRRQIRSEKRKVERARKEAALAATLAAQPPKEAAPTTLPTTPSQKQKYTLFQLGKPKAKKDEDTSDHTQDSKVRPFTRSHKKSASESIVDPRLFHTVRTPSSIEEEEAAITSMNKSKSLSPRSYSPTPAAKLSPRKGSPGKVSPRRGSPAKVSPRRGSPAKVSPRSCSPTPSPRNYSPTPSFTDQQEAGTPKDQYNQHSSITTGVHGKRVPRNAVSVAIAT